MARTPKQIKAMAAPKPGQGPHSPEEIAEQERREAIAAAAQGAPAAPDLRGNGSPAAASGDRGGYDRRRWPSDAPITPLGHMRGTNYFLDFCGQLIPLDTKFAKGDVMQLFGGMNLDWLEKTWPQFGKPAHRGEPPPLIGFHQKDVQEALIYACTTKGIFDPTNKERGRGAHRGADDALVLHCGDAVMISGLKNARGEVQPPSWHKPGVIGDHIYPTAPAIPRPANEPASVAVGQSVLDLMLKWHWKQGDIAGYLVFCWVMAAPMGGALRWRPHLWVNGPSGAGKSTLQNALRDLMGPYGLKTEDASEAGVRQSLHLDTLAIMFDEMEADEHNQQLHKRIIGLARLASSGSSALRGGQDHKSMQFRVASCFLFSSINHHEMPAQDRNRMAIVKLNPIREGTPPLQLPLTLKEWGHGLRARFAVQWPRFEQTLLTYQAAMADAGFSAREQDTYGTLLACGDIALYDSAPTRHAGEYGEPDRCHERVQALAGILSQARAETETAKDLCLGHLSTFRLSAKGGAHQESVARWLHKAAVAIASGRRGKGECDLKLDTYGLAIVRCDKVEGDSGVARIHCLNDIWGNNDERNQLMRAYVAIANKAHGGMREIFKNTLWDGGVWTQSLTEVSGAISGKQLRYDAMQVRSTLVPIDCLVDMDRVIEDARIEIARGAAEAGA